MFKRLIDRRMGIFLFGLFILTVAVPIGNLIMQGQPVPSYAVPLMGWAAATQRPWLPPPHLATRPLWHEATQMDYGH